jgi:hypothetical protein
VLCRNATRLNSDQSLDWPSAAERTWRTCFSTRTKLLTIQALINMTLAGARDECALRAVAVRLYGIWDAENSESPEGKRVRGCIGKLVKALISSLKDLPYHDFIQGNREVTIDQLRRAADSATTNPDGLLDRMSDSYALRLGSWAQGCSVISADEAQVPYLASIECGCRTFHVCNLEQVEPADRAFAGDGHAS